MTKFEITHIVSKYYKISTDTNVNNWNFLKEYKHVESVYDSEKFSTSVAVSTFIDIRDFTNFLNEKLNPEKVLPNTIKELNCIIKELEKELNPSFITHCKKILNLPLNR